MKKHKYTKDIVFFAVILILVLVMLYSGLQILESTVLYRGQHEDDAMIASRTITVDGVSYFPRQDITVVLVMGVDRYGPVQDSGFYTNTGAADVDILVVFNEREKTVDMLYLNRDTMLTMPVLGVGGHQAGTYYGQLALAHTFGGGLEDSCENTRQAISDFLGGVKIDYYVSMNMDAIAILNDAVGGVTVNVTEDFSKVDPSLTMGKMTLTGKQAITYVRSRKDVGDQLNLTRIERQKEYITGFADSLRAKQDSEPTFALTTYSSVEPYVVTDCSGTVLASLLDKYAAYTLREVISPKGENVMGEKYMEFHVDEKDLGDIVLRMFYAPKE